MNIADLDSFSPRLRRRKEIIIEFHKMRSVKPQEPKKALIRAVAEKLGYSIDKNKSNSTIATAIRKWERN